MKISTIADIEVVGGAAFKILRANALHILIFLAFFFPYVQLFPNANDVQAHVTLIAIAAGGAIVLKNKPVINWLLLPAVAAPIIGLAYDDPFGEIARATAIYTSVFFVYLFTSQAIEDGFPVISLIKFVLFANLLIGVWQLFLDPSAFDFLAPVRSSLDRGVTALAVEPSFYGLAVSLMSFIILVFAKSSIERAFYAGLGIIQVVALSQSSLAILFGVGCAALYVFSLWSIRQAAIIFLFGLAIAGSVFFLLMPTTSRAYSVVVGLVTNPWDVLAEDVSVSLRVSHVFLSNAGAALSLFIPHGFSAFEEYISSVNSWPLYVEPINRIMSGYGSALFELGVFSFPLLYFNFRPLWGQPGLVSRIKLAALALGLFLLFQNAVSFALPLYAITLAILNQSNKAAQNEVTS